LKEKTVFSLRRKGRGEVVYQLSYRNPQLCGPLRLCAQQKTELANSRAPFVFPVDY